VGGKTGVNAAAVEQATGLSVDTHTIAGALQSPAISEEDLERGLFDGAEIRFWLVDWTDPESRLLQAAGRIAEVRRGDGGFEAEIAGLAEAMNQPMGRAYLRRCDRRLGDAGCKVSLEDPAYRGTGTVAEVRTPRLFLVDGLDGYDSRWFDRGQIAWTGGANEGGTGHVKSHRKIGGLVEISLWQTPPMAVVAGDGFTVSAGCDKTAETCRGRFGNLLNFGGFPFMPGDDWAAGYPNTGGGHDGGSLFRG